MTAKETAIKDIKDELRQESRSFITFRKKLNPIMNFIVKRYLKLQDSETKV